MGLHISVIIYAERKRGTPHWDLKWEKVDELTTHWLVRKLETFPIHEREFVLLNELKLEVNGMDISMLDRYFSKVTPS